MPVLPTYDCCEQSSCASSSSSVQVPGPSGSDGADGADGSDGLSAFTLTTGSFTLPAELANITVDVVTSSPFAVGQIVYVSVGGAAAYMEVSSKPSSTQLFLRNLRDTPNSRYLVNSDPGTIFASGASVQPAGVQGPGGSGGGGSGGGGLAGSGSPEGVVTANPGISYWDSTNFVFYIKNSGTGNTGWRELIA